MVKTVLNSRSVQRLVVIVGACLLPLSGALAHSYPTLTSTNQAQDFVTAIEGDGLYPLNLDSSSQLNDYYVGLRYRQPFADKDRVLNDPQYYSSLQAFSGEVCGLIWRHGNRALPKVRVTDSAVESTHRVRRTEQTPFYSASSPWFDNAYSLLYTGERNAYRLFLASGEQFKEQQIAYPIHRVGPIFGKNAGTKNDLVLSVQANYLVVKDGKPTSQTLLVDDVVLLTMVKLPFTYSDIRRLESDQTAFELCSQNAELILPLI